MSGRRKGRGIVSERYSKAFAEKIMAELDVGNMRRHVLRFNEWHRYSGSAEGEQSVDYIVETMQAHGVQVRRERYDVYRSLPLEASVCVTGRGAAAYPATPYVYSGVAKDLTGELYFDERSTAPGVTQKENLARYRAFRGKIVLTYDNSYELARQAAKNGALAILTIWHADLAHHGTIGGVWGTPGIDDQDRFPFLPYAEVVKSDGEALIALLEGGPVTVRLNIAMDNGIVPNSMPIATIPGKSDKFVLVSGHYDSWYEGITDNAASNAIMMELARALQRHCGELERAVVFAWWSGHSDARYAGSAIYGDRYWKELHDNCVAHFNVDIAGSAESDLILFNAAGIEGKDFMDAILAEFNDEPPRRYVPMGRFADQAFFGAHVPFTIMPKFTSKAIESAGRAAFHWWHTKEDTLDKCSDAVMLRDARLVTRLTCAYANAERLPADLPGFALQMERYLREIAAELHPDFDLEPAFPYMEKLQAAVQELEAACATHSDTDDILLRVAGEMTRLTYTYSSPYLHDLAVLERPFPILSKARGVTPDNSSAEYYLFLQADFLRHRNRLVGQISSILEAIDYQYLKWRFASGNP